MTVSILSIFAMIMAAIALVMICAFGGLFLGAYIHHRGVVTGSGNRESFTGRVPEGEVFRLQGEDLPEEPPEVKIPGVSDNPEVDKAIAEKMGRFAEIITGGK